MPLVIPGERAVYPGNKTIQGTLTVNDGDTSSPSVRFSGSSGSGLIGGAGNAVGLASGSSSVIYSTGGAVQVKGTGGGLAWSSGGNAHDAADLYLQRDAANILAQRNGASAQEFRLSETHTDASNNSRLRIRATASGDFDIFPEASGTGTLRGLKLGTSGGRLGFFGTTAIARQTVAVAAIDAATTQALANDLRTKLINLGLVA